MAIGNSIVAGRAADRLRLSQALAALDFSAKDAFASALEPLVGQWTIPVDAMKDAELAAAVRADNFTNVPTSVGAILDIQIYGAGYYAAKQVGYAPYLSVTARVLDTRAPAEIVDEFDYEVGYGDAKGDPRFFSSPALLVGTLDGFRDRAVELKHETTAVYERVAKQLVEDVDRVIRRLPRLS